MNYKMRAACLLALTLLMAASCNKDNTIEPEIPDEGFRPATMKSSPYQTHVYEYTPAPGQFVNETATGGFSGTETTPQAAAVYALKRLSNQQFVSLGAFGGYIIVGFDHSIANASDIYDFAIKGNAMAESNEPGIVWVMQDTNRNGEPDDTWYQLRGSAYGQPGTVANYSVTYYRPSAPQMPVEWTDSEGTSGTIDYLPSHHKQDYYYPAWIAADSYTLTGTRLEARNVYDEATGNWRNEPFDWGYADNMGSDALPGNKQWVGFDISNAIDQNGHPVKLAYIDFVKVQQAVQAKSGPLGENSCEVFSVADYSLLFK